MLKKSVRALDVRGKRALVRVDFNVPLDKTGAITDDTRITAALPTLQYLLDQGARVILMSHLGRPDGQTKPEFSLAPVAAHLGHLLPSTTVRFAPDCTGPAANAAVASLAPGEVLLLENTRFHPEEETNDPAFAARLATHGDLFVQDAFGAAHRAHASTEGVAHHLPDRVTGFLVEKELDNLLGKLDNPVHPFVVIMGGKKVADKIKVITRLLPKADSILIGGAMAYAFRKAQGHEIGNSFTGKTPEEQADSVHKAGEILEIAGDKLVLPADSLHTAEFKDGAATAATAPFDQGGSIPPGREGIDIGPVAIQDFCSRIAKAQTILWNGPMGVFEIDAFAHGTRAVAEAVAASPATSIIGGGDSVTALNKFQLGDKVTFMSTGGGASLELLEGKPLPGIDCLDDA